MEEQIRQVHHTDWILWVLIAAVCLVLAAKLYNPERFRAFLVLPVSVKRKEIEESFNPALGRGLFDVSLSLLSYIMIALSLFLILHPYRNHAPLLQDWQMYLRLLFVLALFFVGKNLVGLLVGWVFRRSEEVARSQNINLAYRAWTAIFLIPLCALMVFYTPAYQVSYIILIVCLSVGYFMALQFSSFKIWQVPAVSYYKIFYLCALEITPLLFLVGWLKSLYQ